jgi:hypothetical protein
MGSATQAAHQDQGDLQVEGKVEHLRWSTGVWGKLLGDLLSIRLVLILSILLSWHTWQIDFVLAYPQAPIETPLYMEVPKGDTLNGLPKQSQDYVLELKKNLYGQWQAGQVWYKYLGAGLEDIGFNPSLIDGCVYYWGGMLFLVYADNGIIAGRDPQAIKHIIKDLQTRFKVSDEGNLTDYLGVNN